MIEVEYGWLPLAVMALLLASVHAWFPRFDVRYARSTPFWMGLIGGVASGYALLYLLPKVARMTASMVGLDPSAEINFLDLRLYLLMLTGMVAYLLMLHLDAHESRLSALSRVFDYLVHGAYSLLVGYVFIEMASRQLWVNLTICIILALHLTGMNHVLRNTRATGYDRYGRWCYLLLVLLGAGFGLTTELPKLFIYALTAFLAGIILVFVLSEELPLQHPLRVPWYLLGLAVFITAQFAIMQLDPRPAY